MPSISLFSNYSAIEKPGDELLRSQLEGYIPLPSFFLESQHKWLLALLLGRGDYIDAAIVNYIWQEWDKDFQPPFYIKKENIERTEVYGGWLNSILELTTACSSYWSYKGLHIGSWQWFDGVISIWRSFPIQIMLMNFYSLDSSARKKYDIRDELRKVCDKISVLEQGCYSELDYFNLMLGTSIFMAKDSPKFKQKKLNPFIKNTRAVITKMSSSGQTFEIRDGEAWERQGKGRHVKRFLTPAWLESPIMKQ